MSCFYDYGLMRRELRMSKMRGTTHATGSYRYVIGRSGVEIIDERAVNYAVSNAPSDLRSLLMKHEMKPEVAARVRGPIWS